MRTQLKGVYATRRKRKGGKPVVYWYLRGFGALRPLPGDESEAFAPGTPAFMRAYNDAINAPIKVPTANPVPCFIDLLPGVFRFRPGVRAPRPAP